MTKQLLSLCVGMMIMMGGCLHTDRPEPQAAVEPLPARSFARQWAIGLPLRDPNQILYYDVVPNAPIHLSVQGDRVVVYDRKGDAYGIDRQSGELKFIHHVTSDGTTLQPPLVEGQQVTYPREDSFAVFQEGSRHVREVNLDRPISSPVVKAGDRLIFGTKPRGQSRLTALRLKNDNVADWEVVSFGSITGSPVVQEDVAYFGTDTGRLYAVDIATGGQVLPLEGGYFQAGGAVVGDVRADEQAVYFASADSKLYSIDRLSGKVNWIYFGGASLTTGPLVRGDIVYQYVPRRGMVAIHKTDGKYHRQPLWVVPDARQYLSEDPKYVYLRGDDNSVLAVDRKSGKVAFRSGRSDFVAFGTNTSDSTIYAATATGRIIALKPVLKEGEVGQMVLATEPQSMRRG